MFDKSKLETNYESAIRDIRTALPGLIARVARYDAPKAESLKNTLGESGGSVHVVLEILDKLHASFEQARQRHGKTDALYENFLATRVAAEMALLADIYYQNGRPGSPICSEDTLELGAQSVQIPGTGLLQSLDLRNPEKIVCKVKTPEGTARIKLSELTLEPVNLFLVWNAVIAAKNA